MARTAVKEEKGLLLAALCIRPAPAPPRTTTTTYCIRKHKRMGVGEGKSSYYLSECRKTKEVKIPPGKVEG